MRKIILLIPLLLLSIFENNNCMHRRMFKNQQRRQRHMSRRHRPKKVRPRTRRREVARNAKRVARQQEASFYREPHKKNSMAELRRSKDGVGPLFRRRRALGCGLRCDRYPLFSMLALGLSTVSIAAAEKARLNMTLPSFSDGRYKTTLTLGFEDGGSLPMCPPLNTTNIDEGSEFEMCPNIENYDDAKRSTDEQEFGDESMQEEELHRHRAQIHTQFVPEVERGKETESISSLPEELVIEKDINDLNEIRQYFDQMDEKTLVFFDLDDTVFEPEGELGSTLWSYHLADKLKNETGMGLMEAFGNVFPLWVLAQRYINLKTIDNSDQIIKTIQQKGVNVIGLTNRPICVVEKTIEALERLGIKFSESHSDEIQLEDDRDGRSGIFKNGVLFGNIGHKGDFLSNFLRKIDHTPEKIFFIDDSKRNIRRVKETTEQLAEQFGIGSILLRFTHKDKRKESFDYQAAEKQTVEFKKRFLGVL